MKIISIKYYTALLMLSALSLDAQENSEQPLQHKNADSINYHLEKLTESGVPGVALAILNEEGIFLTTRGYANIEKKENLKPNHLQYLQSISKTYHAVALLQLYERGRIDLDASITSYLGKDFTKYIPQAEKINVRMLLNHTSGIPEYNDVPAYVSFLLQHPNHLFQPIDYLKYSYKKKLDFEPGTRYTYRNTNYVLLALIMDVVTGDHAKYLEENIFKPLNLSNTFYRANTDYLNYSNLVGSYWDRYSDGVLENASILQKNNVRMLIGDDGIVATPEDAVKFLAGLMQGRLLQISTLEIMKTWVKDRKGNDTYGLGLDFTNNAFGKAIAIGHSGAGIGAGCQLYYLPEKNTYFFIAINLGSVTDSPIHAEAQKRLALLYKTMLQ